MTTPSPRGHADEVVRLRAVEALAGEATPGAVAQLVRALEDESWRIREAAVHGLTRRGGGEVVGALLGALRDSHRDPGVLNGALQVLADCGLDTLGSLTGFLTGPDVDLRAYAALALGAQHDVRAVPALIRALEDGDSNVRFHAVEALGRLRAGAAVEALAAVAESRDFFLGFPALDALASIGDCRVACRLVPLLEDELLQPAALEALGRLGDEDVVAPLTSLLNRGAAPAGQVARALLQLHQRCEKLHRKGAYLAGLVRQTLTPGGIQGLLDALPEADNPELQGLALVLGWLEGATVDRALTRLLGRPGVREEVIEALVRKGGRVIGLLSEQLKAEDLETRQAAVLALGRIGDSAAVPPLMDALSDRELMVSAAGALAMIGDPRPYPTLLPLLAHGAAVVRRAAVSALNSLSHPRMATDMAALVHDPRPLARESAAKICGYAAFPECLDLLLELCRDPEANVRRAAVESLPGLEGPRVLSALAVALEDAAAAVRAAAAHALGQLEGGDGLAALQAALADPDPWVRYFAARALGRKRHGPALEALTGLACEDPAMQVRVAAVEAIGGIGGSTALPVLALLAEDADADLARAALTALAVAGHPDALPPLLAALRSPDPARRGDALRALGQSRNVAVVGALEQVAATDPDAGMRRAAIDALADLSLPQAVSALVALTASPLQREACVAALARLGEQQLPFLAKGLSHASLDVRRAVVEALTRSKDPRASDLLRAALADPEAAVRLGAIAALAHSETKRSAGPGSEGRE